MKLLSLLTNTTLLIILHTLISTWFLFDFFITTNSITANNLLRSRAEESPTNDDQLFRLSSKIKEKHCNIGDDARQPIFDKVILVVIDALGSQFLNVVQDERTSTVKMPFVEDLLSKRKGMRFVAEAAIPTVTMPRIKALLSGTIPSFIDVAFNLARDTSKFDDDNILRILRARDKSIVFYGDDTWLSLFDRNLFKRVKETFSFYATDYTTIDTNVTNEALPEVGSSQIDWDYLILHYLGLDHIGHVFGTNQSSLIDKKLLELDNVINHLYKFMSEKKQTKTLLIVTGDHGMSPEGNHGGGSKLEIETAMIFLPINFNLSNTDSSELSKLVKQIDFPNTLSAVMAIPAPIHSRGVAIEPLLNNVISDQGRITCTAFANTMQLIELIKGEEFAKSQELHDVLILLDAHGRLANNSQSNDIARQYFAMSRRIQHKLLETIANSTHPVIIMIFLFVITFLTMVGLRRTSIHSYLLTASPKPEMYLSILVFIMPIIMHGSTDFIESENLFWPLYCILTSLAFFTMAAKETLLKELDPLRVALLFITFILTAIWNKYWFFKNILSSTTLTIIASTFMCNTLMQSSDINDPKTRRVVVLLLSFGIFSCRIVEESPDYNSTMVIFIQRVVLLALLLYSALNLISSRRTGSEVEETIARFIRKISASWIALVFLLSRPYNLLFIMANVILEASVNNVTNTMHLSGITKILLYIHFAQSAFYNQGNSNLFTTIDVRPAFYGQTEYNIYYAVLLVTISTFSTQIYWYIKLFQRFQEKNYLANKIKHGPIDLKKNMIKSVLEVVTFRNFLSLSYYMVVMNILRNHLFVWSVLSPKLIYHNVSNNVILFSCLSIFLIHGAKQRLLDRRQIRKEVIMI